MRQDPKEDNKLKPVDNDDMVSALVHFDNGVKGHIGASRVSWGKKCGLTWEIHGTEGTIMYNQERLNEIKLYTKSDDIMETIKVQVMDTFHCYYLHSFDIGLKVFSKDME